MQFLNPIRLPAVILHEIKVKTMICQLYKLFFFILSTFLLFSCQNNAQKQSFDELWHASLIDSLSKIYAPDKRVAHFQPSIERASEGDCFVLRGSSNQAAASSTLRGILAAKLACWKDSLRQLPVAHLGEDTLGIVNVSVANLRAAPSHSAELATQALLGTPLVIYDQQADWFLVQTPDQYLAWLEAGAFVRTDDTTLLNYLEADLAIVQSTSTRLLSRPNSQMKDTALIVRDLTQGNLVKKGPAQGEWQSVVLPDGVLGWLPKADLLPYEEWLGRQSKLQLPDRAIPFYGLPYLWGGTSAKGMDCSGFTKMTYWMNGFVIPRDASQQVHAGEEVPITPQLEALAVGDLLFFGNLRADGSQRITHVGLYLGQGRFVHSGADNGYIKEESLWPDSPSFAAHRRETLLRVKRLAAASNGVVGATEALRFWQR